MESPKLDKKSCSWGVPLVDVDFFRSSANRRSFSLELWLLLRDFADFDKTGVVCCIVRSFCSTEDKLFLWWAGLLPRARPGWKDCLPHTLQNTPTWFNFRGSFSTSFLLRNLLSFCFFFFPRLGCSLTRQLSAVNRMQQCWQYFNQNVSSIVFPLPSVELISFA